MCLKMTKTLKHFGIRCKKCGRIVAIEICESESYRNDTYYEYPEAVCKRCHIKEGLL